MFIQGGRTELDEHRLAIPAPCHTSFSRFRFFAIKTGRHQATITDRSLDRSDLALSLVIGAGFRFRQVVRQAAEHLVDVY
jgi:hypothetical protein